MLSFENILEYRRDRFVRVRNGSASWICEPLFRWAYSDSAWMRNRYEETASMLPDGVVGVVVLGLAGRPTSYASIIVIRIVARSFISIVAVDLNHPRVCSIIIITFFFFSSIGRPFRIMAIPVNIVSITIQFQTPSLLLLLLLLLGAVAVRLGGAGRPFSTHCRSFDALPPQCRPQHSCGALARLVLLDGQIPGRRRRRRRSDPPMGGRSWSWGQAGTESMAAEWGRRW
mmetsp:Transcript_9013/g.25342  ORF Transcript_9013/g.25342 Transcript_9013/m.25342 type:complete len:229 (+) Transcript_9013:375-1061(+)